MKLIKKEFSREEIDTLIVTIELNNKHYDIILDNQSNYSEEKYQFSTSEYHNDDIDEDIIEQFENSNFYKELCVFARREAEELDDELENDIINEIDKNYYIYKEDNHYYNNYKFTIFKKKDGDDFVLRVQSVRNFYLEQSFYEIYQNDFDDDEEEVVLNEFYEYDFRNEFKI